jgi:hypothetical protein
MMIPAQNGFAATLLCLTLLTTGCDSQQSPPEGANASPAVAAEATKAVAHASNNDGNAPVEMIDLDSLFPLEEAARIAGQPAAKAKRSRLNKSINSLHYAWPSDRKVTLPGGMKIPAETSLQLQQPTLRIRTNLGAFERQYLQAPDPAQAERSLEMLRNTERYKGMSSQQQMVAENILRSAVEKEPLEKVEGLGKAAAWDAKNLMLYVLLDDLVLIARADISNDPKDNLKAATAVAQTALARR